MARTTSGQDRSFANELLSQLGGDASWVVEWVAAHFSPDEVYDESMLIDWALDNGFMYRDDCVVTSE